MPGLFGTLQMGARALQTQRQGIEVAGHNLANVNNPAFSRQRLVVQTSTTLRTSLGAQGTGADAVAIERIRDSIVDSQIESESSVSGSLEAQQEAMQYAQAGLGQKIERANGSEADKPAPGLAESMSDLFNAFQSVSAQPTSLAERQVLMMKAADAASRFTQIDSRLSQLQTSLDENLSSDVAKANALLQEIAEINGNIGRVELEANGAANDLRDLRQGKIEELSRLVKIEVAPSNADSLDVSISGSSMVTTNSLVATLELYDSGSGVKMVRAAGSAGPLDITGGRLHGTMEVRDGEIKTLRERINTLASTLITEVNVLHASGFALNGTTGAAFYLGSDASDIRLNTALKNDPALFQASGANGKTGDNTIVLAMAQLAAEPVAALGSQTFSDNYAQTVAGMGQSLKTLNGRLEDQNTVTNLLQRQRDGLSGVSLDEEMTDLVKFQKAFEASARLINVVDELLETVLSMSR